MAKEYTNEELKQFIDKLVIELRSVEFKHEEKLKSLTEDVANLQKTVDVIKHPDIYYQIVRRWLS